MLGRRHSSFCPPAGTCSKYVSVMLSGPVGRECWGYRQGHALGREGWVRGPLSHWPSPERRCSRSEGRVFQVYQSERRHAAFPWHAEPGGSPSGRSAPMREPGFLVALEQVPPRGAEPVHQARRPSTLRAAGHTWGLRSQDRTLFLLWKGSDLRRQQFRRGSCSGGCVRPQGGGPGQTRILPAKDPSGWTAEALDLLALPGPRQSSVPTLCQLCALKGQEKAWLCPLREAPPGPDMEDRAERGGEPHWHKKADSGAGAQGASWKR